VSERLVARFVRFRQRVVESSLPLRGPHWEEAEDFELDRHLHRIALLEPGGPAELERIVSDLMSTPLDRSKPLWDAYLVDNYGSGSAMVFRIHHCIADGIALARVMLSLTDAAPEGGFAEEEQAPERRRGRVGAVVNSVISPLRIAGGVAGSLVHEGAEAVIHPSTLARLAEGAGQDARVVRKLLLTGADADTVLRGEVGVARGCAWSRELDLREIKAIGKNAGATVNDVMVSALSGGLRDYLSERNSLADEIRAMVPFNLRRLDEPLPSTLGNAFGLVYLPLPIGVRSVEGRLIAVKHAMDEIKRSPEGAVAYGILGVVGAAPVEVEKRVVDLFSSKGSMVLTNVPGPTRPVYLAGTAVRGVLVWAPTSGSVAMSLSIMSYDGRVTVGVMADAQLVPDPARIVAGFERELERLKDAYR
jgi:diacylglycerol O-acyltransferase / wax synthase